MGTYKPRKRRLLLVLLNSDRRHFVLPFQELADDEVYVYPEANSDSIPLYRYCDICDLPKPPRTAHCKYCEKCTPKMDHHCAWTANCVGEKNHKAFLLFVVYMLLLSSYIVAITLLRIVALVLNSSEVRFP